MRGVWLRHSLVGAAKSLKRGDQLRLTWRDDHIGWTCSEGVAVSCCDGSGVLVKYKDVGLQPIPPVEGVRIRRFEVRKVFNLYKLVKCKAEVGKFIHVKFKKHDSSPVNWSGVIVSTFDNGTCLVKYFLGDRSVVYLFPPPRNSAVTILNVRFYTRIADTGEGLNRSERTRLKRFKKLLVVETPDMGSSPPIADYTSPIDSSIRTIVPKKCKRNEFSKSGIALASWNVRTLVDRSRLEGLIAMMKLRRISAMCIQETRRNDSSPPIDVGDYVWFESSANDAGQHGVACLMSPAFARNVQKKIVIVQSRIIAIETSICTVICIYMPTSVETEHRQSCFDALTAYLNVQANRDKIFMLGDFNSRPQSQLTRNSPLSLKQAASQLEDFMHRHSLYSQLVMRKPKSAEVTFKLTTLDYFLSKGRRMLLNYNTYHGPFASDHRVLAVRLNLRWPRKAHAVEQKVIAARPDFAKLRNIPVRTAFVSAVRASPHASYPQFVAACTSALHHIPLQDKSTLAPKRSWNSDLVRNLASMEVTLRDSGVLCTAIDSANQADVNRLLGMYTKYMQSHPRHAWSHIASLRHKAAKQLAAADTTERLSLFTSHFRKVFAGQTAPFDQSSFDEVLVSLRRHTGSLRLVFDPGIITINELEIAVGQCKSNKAAGIDGIPNEVLKCAELHDIILPILNALLVDCQQSQRTSIMVPLPKKGDLQQLTNWRGISLMPTITKLFHRILLNRLQPILDPHLVDTQNGFRAERGCTEHIMSLAMLCDLARKHTNFPLYAVFVDFSKAFDSVHWQVIEQVLRSWGVPDVLVCSIMRVMRGHTVRVRCDGVVSADEIDVCLGVLQGDTLAPFLFVVCLDAVLKCLRPKKGLSFGPTDLETDRHAALTTLGFADDLSLLSSSIQGLQHNFTVLERCALSIGLRLNLGAGKTERFNLADTVDPTPLLTSKGEIIPIVKHYKYLGVFATDQYHDWSVRQGKCWAALKSLKGVWESNISAEIKRALFYALIEPICTYGITAWPLTRKFEDVIDGCVGRMLRYALGLAPAYASRHDWPTEKLYDSHPFMSTLVRTRRLSLFAHCYRATYSKRVYHPFVDLLFWDLTDSHLKKHSGGQRITLQQSIFKDLNISFPEQLHNILMKPARHIKRILDASQRVKYERINKRKAAEAELLDNVPLIPLMLSRIRRQERQARLTADPSENA